MPDLTKLRLDRPKEEKPASDDHIDVPEVDLNALKTAAVAAATTVAALLFSLLVADYFFEPRAFGLSDLQYAIFIAALGLLFASWYFLQTLFIKSFGKIAVFALLNTAALMAPLYQYFSIELLGAAAALYAILLFAAYWGWHDLRLLIKIKVLRLGRNVIPKVVTALALFIAFVFYLNVSAGHTNIITQNLLDTLIFQPTEALMGSAVPEFSFYRSGDEVVEDFARRRIENLPEAQELPEAAREDLVDQQAEGIKMQMERAVRTNIDFQRNVGEAVYALLIEYLIHGSETSRIITAISVALLAFIIVKTAGIVLGYLALALAFVFYEVLISLNFATVSLEGRTREIIILK